MSAKLHFSQFDAEFDSAKEAADFVTHLQLSPISVTPPNGDIVRETKTTQGPQTITVQEDAEVRRVLGVIATANGKGAPASEIGAAFGLEGYKGMGPKARKMARVLEAKGLDIKDVREIYITSKGNYWKRGPNFQQALIAFGLASQPPISENPPSAGAQSADGITELRLPMAEERRM